MKIEFNPDSECRYAIDYERIFRDIVKAYETFPVDRARAYEISAYRELILNDLFFIVNWIMGIPGSNRPFVVRACQEVEQGPEGWTMDLWARKHWKSSILTKARTLQRVLKYPEKCTMIASHTRPIAKQKFLRPIMCLLETHETLKAAFPEVLYRNPKVETKWSEDDGIIVKRQNKARSEATVEAWGIKEGMPISVHFDWIILDDLETKDDIGNPEVVKKVRDSVDLTPDLLTEGGTISVVGTPYSHEGVYIPYIRDLKKADGSPAYMFRRKPATHDGTRTGNPVLLAREDLADEAARKGEYTFNCQQLINPTPVDSAKLNPDHIHIIEPELIPGSIYNFMLIDPAGDSKDKSSDDAFAALMIGVEPKADEIGASRIFILNGFIEPIPEGVLPDMLARLYCSVGLVQKTGYERNMNTTPGWVLHFKNILKTKGRHLSEEYNLVHLRHGNRNKITRITSALETPLLNGKIHISKSCPVAVRERLRQEMLKFPYWHDDGIDCLAYLYDIISEYKFARSNDFTRKLKYAPCPV